MIRWKDRNFRDKNEKNIHEISQIFYFSNLKYFLIDFYIYLFFGFQSYNRKKKKKSRWMKQKNMTEWEMENCVKPGEVIKLNNYYFFISPKTISTNI